MPLGVAAVVIATLSGCGEPENDQTPAAEPGADAAETAVVVYARAADGSPLMTRDEDPVPSCPDCRIRLDPLKVFGSHADAVLLRRFPLLVRDSRGFTYAVPHSAYDHEILVFDPAGKQVRTVGRLGQGPGELRTVDAIAVGRGDSLLVAHDQDRLTVFDSAGNFGRTFRTPYFAGTQLQGTIVPLPGGDLVRAGGVRAEDDLLRFPLHLLSSEGEHLRAFGSPGVTTGDMPRYLVYAGLDETVWAVEGANYRLERLDLSGTLLRVIAVRDRYTSAFLTRAELDSVRATAQRIRPLHELYREMPDHLPHPPIPEIGGVAEHAGGRVVVAMRRAAEGWNEVPVVWDAPDPEHISPGEENKQRVYATQLDVIDIASGRLWARTTVPGYGALLNDGSFARMGYGDDGVIRIEVFRLTMHAP